MGFRRRHGNPDKGDGDLLKLARRFGAKVTVTTGVGGGFPDWVMGLRGLTILIERKNPGGDLRDSQVDFAKSWTGGPLIVVAESKDLLALVTSRDPLKHCAARDLRMVLGYRTQISYQVGPPTEGAACIE